MEPATLTPTVAAVADLRLLADDEEPPIGATLVGVAGGGSHIVYRYLGNGKYQYARFWERWPDEPLADGNYVVVTEQTGEVL